MARPTRSNNLRRVLVGVLATALAGASWFVSAPPAQAAGYTLTASGAGTTTTNKARKLTVAYKNNGKPVAKATVALQYRRGSMWVTEKNVAVKNGLGAVLVKHTAMDRTYRFYVKGKASSRAFVVRFIPTVFVLRGSGSGHGVGLSQYGAYALARAGRTASNILTTYYPGTTPSTANNTSNPIRVQVLGPDADTRKTTTLRLDKGGFTLKDAAGKTLFTSTKPGAVDIGVKGALVTAKVTLSGGAVKTLPSTKRLTLAWNNASGTVSVAGAQGAYRFGTLTVTSIKSRPNVVNVLAVNTEYLQGLDEVPASWGANGGREALKAQVVAARTYAIRAMAAGVKSACDCHLYDDTRSQNFVGWKKTGPAANKPWVDAVKATVRPNANQPSGSEVDILRDAQGNFAETPFFASTGRKAGTGSNANVFGTRALPYLRGVNDPYSAMAPRNLHLSWTKNLSQARARAIFGTYVKKLAVTATYPGGLVRTITATTVTGARKSVTMATTEKWRSALGTPAPWLVSITGK